jgi:hypothetical protein
MKNQFKNLYQETIRPYFIDTIIVTELSITIVLAVIAYIVWKRSITDNQIYVFTVLNYYPIQILLLIFIVHLALSIYAYKNDKNISYLLNGSVVFFAALILLMEVFYLFNR